MFSAKTLEGEQTKTIISDYRPSAVHSLKYVFFVFLLLPTLLHLSLVFINPYTVFADFDWFLVTLSAFLLILIDCW